MQPVDLFGRDAELGRLAELLAAGRAVAIVGEAGVGKTTLVRAAAERAGLELREGGALETLAWTPHLALRRAVGDGLRGDPTAVAIEVEQRLGPQLLFIDDLQWTDDATRSVLALLAGRVAVVMTVRTPDPQAARALAAASDAGAQVIELAGVDPRAAMAIARRARPSIAPAALEVVVRQAGGNPLLLEELASRGRPSSSLARALTSRLDRLTPAGRDSFALLAVAGRGLPITLLGEGSTDLLATGVAIVDGDTLAARHALLAEAMLGTLTAETRRDCHRRLAALVTDLGERAYHLAGAGRRGEAARAAQDAADRATSQGERAALLELVARMSDGAAATRPAIIASRLLVSAGGSGSRRAIEILEPVVDGPADLLLEREALLGKAYFDTGDLVAARAAYERGRRLDAESDWGGRVPPAASARLASDAAAFVGNVDGDLTTARQLLAEAIATGRTSPRAVATYETLRAYGDGIDTFDAVWAAYHDLADDPDEPGALFSTAHNAGTIALIARGHERAHAALVDAADLLDARDMTGRADELRGEDAQVLLFAGRLAEAVRRCDELLERPLNRRSRQWTATKRAQALGAQGRIDAATVALDAIDGSTTDDYQGRGELVAARIEIASWSGRPTEVLAAYATHVTIPTPSRVTDVIPLLAAQWARLELGIDPGPVVPQQPWLILAAAPLESAGIRSLGGDAPADAARSFAAAADAWLPFHVGRELICRWAHGESLRRAGSTGAAEVLGGALVRAEALGYGALAARVRRSLRQAGVHVAPPRAETDTDRRTQMTAREREALELVGRGLTTPEIARRMGLGRGTVDQILGAAARKLGAASRVQAAAILAEGEAGSRPGRRRMAVRTEADARSAVLAALDGADVAVDSTADPVLVERVAGDLRRLGREEPVALRPVPSGAEPGPDERRLLDLLIEGMSLGEAAGALHVSRRRADRRLAAARRTLGVATSAEALVAFRQRRHRPPD